MIFILFVALFAHARDLTTNVTLESDGAYWSHVDVGSPPQRFSVIMDTGSRLLALPCVDCATCGSKHRRWNASDSNTSRPTNETVVVRYMEGSFLNASIVEDEACVDDVCLESYPIGCVWAESKAFKRQDADGIMGLHGAFVRSVGAFRMCLATRRVSVGMPRGRFDWYPVVDERAFALRLHGVGGVRAVGRRAWIDSGTTAVVVPRALKNRMPESGMCDVQFVGGPPVALSSCVPLSEIDEGDAVILGTPFFRRVPHIVFTSTHVGFGDDDGSCEDDDDEEDPTPPWALVGVVSAYVASVAMTMWTFAMS